MNLNTQSNLTDTYLEEPTFNLTEERKELAFKLLKRDFEVVNRQNALSALLGEVSFYEQVEDELYAIELSIELMLGRRREFIEKELFTHLEELLSCRYFEYIHKKTTLNKKAHAYLIAKDLSDYLETVANTPLGSWYCGGREQFLRLTFSRYPDGGCDYFRGRYANQLKKPITQQ